jgi:hypothetical protein
MPDNKFMELVISMITRALLHHLSSQKGGAAVTCAEVAEWSATRILAEHDAELGTSDSLAARTSWNIFRQTNDELRERILRCVQVSLEVEGERVVTHEEIASFTYLAVEENQPAHAGAK